MINLELNELKSQKFLQKGAVENPNPLLTMPTDPGKGKEWKFQLTTKAMELMNLESGKKVMFHYQGGKLYLVSSSNISEEDNPLMKVYKNGTFSSKKNFEDLVKVAEVEEGAVYRLVANPDPQLENVAVLEPWEEEEAFAVEDPATDNSELKEDTQPEEEEQSVPMDEDPLF
jgi:hypothetical protein